MRFALLPFTLILILLTVTSYGAGTEEKIQLSTKDGLQLAGKILSPAAGKERRPGLVLIHGSGLGTMDLWLPGQVTADGKPTRLFVPIAQALKDAGAVVLRYNKRNTREAADGSAIPVPEIASKMNVTQLVDDVLVAVEQLRRNPAVDPEQIILLGISEGTALGVLAAARDGRIAGLIQLSSQASLLRDLLSYQIIEHNMLIVSQVDSNHDGFLSVNEAAAQPDLTLPIAALDRNGDRLASRQEIRAALVSDFNATVKELATTSWFQEHATLHDIPQRLAAFPGPILLLHGDLDAQTPLSELYLLQDALKGRTNLRAKVYAGLGHGFSPPRGFISTVGPLDPAVLVDLQAWMSERLTKPGLPHHSGNVDSKGRRLH